MNEAERVRHLQKPPNPTRKRRSKQPTGAQKTQVVVPSSFSEPRQSPETEELEKIASLPHLNSYPSNCYCKGKGSHKLPSVDDTNNCNSESLNVVIALSAPHSQTCLITAKAAAPVEGEEVRDLDDDGIGSKANKDKVRRRTTEAQSLLRSLDFEISTPQEGEKRRRRGEPLSCFSLTDKEDHSFSMPTNEVDEEALIAAASAKRKTTRDDKPPKTNRKKKKKKESRDNKSQQLPVVSPFFHKKTVTSSTENQTQNSPSMVNPLIPLIKEKIRRILGKSPYSKSSLPGEDGKTIEKEADNNPSKSKEDFNVLPNEAEKTDAEDAGIDAKRSSVGLRPPEETQEKVRVVSSYFQTPPLTVQQQQQQRGNNDNVSLKLHSIAKTRRPTKKNVVVVSRYFCNVAKQKEGKSECKRRSINAPALSASQKRDEAYQRVISDNQWKPPRSHFPLLQEDHVHDPWRVLVICMLLNRTSGTQACKVITDLFTLCPDAMTATKAPREEIEKLIQTLGLQRKRAIMIQRFSKEYLEDGWTHVTQLHGVGKYAADAYAIFCTGKWDRFRRRNVGVPLCGEAGLEHEKGTRRVEFLAAFIKTDRLPIQRCNIVASIEAPRGGETVALGTEEKSDEEEVIDDLEATKSVDRQVENPDEGFDSDSESSFKA
ncbi:hypothetical protein NE237_025213 [Protea cynaroides]|uniref:HhH-GPD domain-containing protein n=1 Tax=Protea cynaroides TaxID=273540 RepID=A0A9Q0H1H2_9MAGN|nr:hypothetical protein NE237_025213 [Protea cynaroides]